MRPRNLLLLPLLFLPFSAVAQEVIVHDETFSREDGDPEKDADGEKNGVVVWKGGAVHVVWSGNRGMPFREGDSLVVQPGAIIKLSSTFKVDDNGELTEWRPVGSFNFCATPQKAIRLEGVTVTDIRDDEVGGDTNQDGSATKPGQNNSFFSCGTDGDVFTGSTFRYVQIESRGSVSFTQNSFYASPLRLSPGSDADIVGNDFVSCTAISAGGSDALISGNTVEWDPSLCRTTDELRVSVIGVGGSASRATVIGNTIEAPKGISASSGVSDTAHRFQDLISSNLLRNPDPNDDTSFGISVFLQSVLSR